VSITFKTTVSTLTDMVKRQPPRRVVPSSAPIDKQVIGEQPAAEESLEQDGLAMDQHLADSLFISDDESFGEVDPQLTLDELTPPLPTTR
jgi:hypothetical protein